MKSNSNSADSGLRLLQAMEFHSRQMDGDLLQTDEFGQLASMDVSGGSPLQNFRSESQRLRVLLKAIPVTPVNHQIVMAVSRAMVQSGRGRRGSGIRYEVASPIKLVVAGPRENRAGLRGGSRWSRQVTVLLTLMALILVCLPAIRRERPAQEVPMIAAVRAPLSNRLEGEMRLLSASPGLSSDGQASVTWQGDDWQVVVLRVDVADRDTVIREIEKVANATGLRMQPMESADDAGGDSLGVLLTSLDVQSSAAVSFVGGMAESDVVRSWTLNPSEVGSLGREELISAIRQSMLNPTASELHFGEVYVAVPRGLSNSVVQHPPDPDAQNEVVRNPRAKADNRPPLLAGRPIFVLFEFDRRTDNRVPCL